MRIVHAIALDPLRRARVDEAFADVADALAASGARVELYDAERSRVSTKQGPLTDATVVYRGWMMRPAEYARFVDAVRDAGASPLHDIDAYRAAHHLPEWIAALAELTPESALVDSDADVATAFAALGWEAAVLKDWVKSVKTSRGSVLRDARDAAALVAELRRTRGTIEGGLVLRRYEPWRPDTERRYFVLDGRAWASDDEQAIPACALAAARRITASRFFSVDVAQHEDGRERIVELGDGQVSDLVGWSADRFAAMWRSMHESR
jgi:hypothetical protein